MPAINVNVQMHDGGGGTNYVQSYFGIKEIEIGTKSASTGNHMTEIVITLNKLGYKFPQPMPLMYNEDVENAVIQFQKDNGLKETGTINVETLKKMLNISEEKAPDIIISENDEEIIDSEEETTNPHFNSFFSDKNIKDIRKNNQDIIIALGNNTIVKTIHNVYMRGVSTEYDTSGNPISEIYEFIAQDITESDEPNDQYKYE